MEEADASRNRNSISPVMETQIVRINATGHTISHRAQPVPVVYGHTDTKKPKFGDLTDDYHLLEHLIYFSRICENFNVAVPQMAQSLARAIGIQNNGKYNVMIYDYLLAIPEYPATVNGQKQELVGPGRFCNIVCYKSQLFGVCVFPITQNVTFYFPEFSAYTPLVQQMIFTFGDKSLRYCPEKRALAFDFRAVPPQPILLTATLKRKISPPTGFVQVIPFKREANNENEAQRQRNDQKDVVRLE